MIQITSNAYDTTTNAVPTAPVLGQTSGGTQQATTYYVKIAYVFGGPAGVGSAESSLAVAANNLLTVTSPSSAAGATGYNVYAATASGLETLQNTTPIAVGTNWTEPVTGLTTTGEAPFLDTGTTPAAPTLNQTSGGSLAATTYYVKITQMGAALLETDSDRLGERAMDPVPESETVLNLLVVVARQDRDSLAARRVL
jgi:hypothetical protein